MLIFRHCVASCSHNDHSYPTDVETEAYLRHWRFLYLQSFVKLNSRTLRELQFRFRQLRNIVSTVNCWIIYSRTDKHLQGRLVEHCCHNNTRLINANKI